MHSIRTPLLLAVFVLAGCAKATGDAPASSNPSADDNPPVDNDLKNPIRTQIDDGARLFGAHCASCHGASGEGASAPALVGQGALPRVAPMERQHRTGEFATVYDVFEFVRTSMPPGDTDTLSDEDVWSILAFDLAANGVDVSAPLGATAARSLTLD